MNLFGCDSAYKWLKSYSWSHFIYVVIWAHMLLAVWEPPGTKNFSNGILIAEMSFIALYAVDVWLKYHSHDPKQIGNWTRIIVVVMVINTLVTSFAFTHLAIAERVYRINRVFRPWYLFYKSRDLKKLSRSIVGGLPQLTEVGMLIVLFLMLFGFVGFILFWERCGFCCMCSSVRFEPCSGVFVGQYPTPRM